MVSMIISSGDISRVESYGFVKTCKRQIVALLSWVLHCVADLTVDPKGGVLILYRNLLVLHPKTLEVWVFGYLVDLCGSLRLIENEWVRALTKKAVHV